MNVEEAVVPAVGTASARVAASVAAADVHRLLLLDDLWTDLLERAQRGHDMTAIDDLEGMEALVAELDDGLARLRDSAYRLRYLLDATPATEFAGALAYLASQPEAPPRLVERFEGALPDYELRSAAIEACDYVLEELEREIELVHEKLTVLRGGHVPEGDFRLTFRCALFLVAAGATVAGAIGLGGAPVFVGLTVFGTLTSAALSWETTCAGRIAEVTRERR